MPMVKRIVYRKPTRLITTDKSGPRPIPMDAGRPEALSAFTEGMGNGR